MTGISLMINSGAGFLLDLIPAAALVLIAAAVIVQRHRYLAKKRELEEAIRSLEDDPA